MLHFSKHLPIFKFSHLLIFTSDTLLSPQPVSNRSEAHNNSTTKQKRHGQAAMPHYPASTCDPCYFLLQYKKHNPHAVHSPLQAPSVMHLPFVVCLHFVYKVVFARGHIHPSKYGS